MKKIISLILAVTIVIAFSSCSSLQDPSQSAPDRPIIIPTQIQRVGNNLSGVFVYGIYGGYIVLALPGAIIGGIATFPFLAIGSGIYGVGSIIGGEEPHLFDVW